MSNRIFAIFAATALVFASQQAFAQGGRGGGTSAFGSSGSGGFGSSSMGRSSMGGSGFGSSGFGSSGSGGFGSSGFGSSGFGSSGFGNSAGGRGGNSGFGNSGFGNSGFGGSGSGGQFGGGQSFVGRDAADMQGTFQQTSRAQTQFFNNMNRQMSRQNRKPAAQKVQNPPQPMRMEVKVAFNAPQPTNQVVTDTLRARLAKILADHHMSQPTVSVQGDTAVIAGVAASDSERLVIGQLVALEQGIRAVDNQMTVAGETSASIIAPTSFAE